jgi:hypothetical protein
LGWAFTLLPGNVNGFNYHHLITPILVLVFIILGLLAKSQKQV